MPVDEQEVRAMKDLFLDLMREAHEEANKAMSHPNLRLQESFYSGKAVAYIEAARAVMKVLNPL